MNKHFFSFVLLLLAAVILAGCANAPNAQTTDAEALAAERTTAASKNKRMGLLRLQWNHKK